MKQNQSRKEEEDREDRTLDGRKETHVKVLQSNFGAGKTFLDFLNKKRPGPAPQENVNIDWKKIDFFS